MLISLQQFDKFSVTLIDNFERVYFMQTVLQPKAK